MALHAGPYAIMSLFIPASRNNLLFVVTRKAILTGHVRYGMQVSYRIKDLPTQELLIMHNIERKPYETPAIQQLGDLKDITRAGAALNSDSGPFPSDSNPSDAFGPIS